MLRPIVRLIYALAADLVFTEYVCGIIFRSEEIRNFALNDRYGIGAK